MKIKKNCSLELEKYNQYIYIKQRNSSRIKDASIDVNIKNI